MRVCGCCCVARCTVVADAQQALGCVNWKDGKESRSSSSSGRTTGAKNFHDLFGVNEKENGCTVAKVIKVKAQILAVALHRV